MSWHHVGARPSATTMLIRLWLYCHILIQPSNNVREISGNLDFFGSHSLPWSMHGGRQPVWRINHDDVMKWKHFPRYWPFVRGIHRLPVNSPHKGQWRGALMFSMICARANRWINNQNAGDWRRHCAHCDVTVMIKRARCHQLRFTLMEITRVIPVSNNNPMSRYHGHTSGDSGPTNNG